MLEIRETKETDLKSIQSLWADGEVMKFVGFPNGLHEDDESMKDWFRWIEESRPDINHFSIYYDNDYCGETFYNIDKITKRAALDIKLFAKARGKGIAFAALKYAIDQAFLNGAESAFVDPNPANEKALALYRRIGMVQKEMPKELYDKDCPNALFFEVRK